MEPNVNLKGTVFDIKRFALEDGPGIRTTVFFKGCPLHCKWCHSPESLLRKPQVVYIKSKCIKCFNCLNICSKQALEFIEERIRINYNKCNVCGDCSRFCPTEALTIKGREYTVAELVAIIEKDKVFYQNSGGGVTFSGGEPMFQGKYLEILLKECKKMGIHVALDTCGFIESVFLDRIIDLVDLFLYDLKQMDDQKHIDYTGVSNKLILKNLRMIRKKNKKVRARLPLIPEYNDSKENIKATFSLLKELGIIELQVLTLNEAAGSKYAWLGLDYPLENISASTTALDFLKDFATDYGIENLII